MSRHFFKDITIAKKHTKRFSVSLVIRKIAMGYHFTIVKMARISKIKGLYSFLKNVTDLLLCLAL